MHKIKFQFFGLFVAILLAGTSANGTSILGDEFTIGGEIDGENLIPLTNPGVAGTIAGTDGTTGYGFDINAGVSPWTVLVAWVDEDSFDLNINGSSFSKATIVLSDLDFMHAGQAVAISGAAFNIGDSDYTTYFFDPIDNDTGVDPPLPEPYVSDFSANSLTVVVSDFNNQLVNDQPVLRFDVSAAGQAAPVPEPTTMLLFGTGLVVLMGVARRKKK